MQIKCSITLNSSYLLRFLPFLSFGIKRFTFIPLLLLSLLLLDHFSSRISWVCTWVLPRSFLTTHFTARTYTRFLFDTAWAEIAPYRLPPPLPFLSKPDSYLGGGKRYRYKLNIIFYKQDRNQCDKHLLTACQIQLLTFISIIFKKSVRSFEWLCPVYAACSV